MSVRLDILFFEPNNNVHFVRRRTSVIVCSLIRIVPSWLNLHIFMRLY